MAVLMARALPRSRLRPSVPDAKPPGQIPGLAAAIVTVPRLELGLAA